MRGPDAFDGQMHRLTDALRHSGAGWERMTAYEERPMQCCTPQQRALEVWSRLLQETAIAPQDVAIARERVATTAIRLSGRVWRLGWYYRGAKTLVTLGALLVPALTGLDSQRLPADAIFWLIWSISLATSASNAFISLFGIDRSYFSCSQQLAALETEAWSYISLSGSYHHSNHQESFSAFMERCENVLSKTSRRHVQDKKIDAEKKEGQGTDDAKSETASARRSESRVEAM